MVRKSFLVFGLVMLSGAVCLAQRSNNVERPSRGGATNSQPTVSPRATVSNSSGVSVGSTRVSPGFPSRGSSTGFGSVPSGGGPVVPVQSFGGGTTLDRGGWYRCNLFVEQLYRHYAFLPVYDYLWRYAQGDSPLTTEAVRFALSDSIGAAALLHRLGEDLHQVIEVYTRGELTRDQFNAEVKATTKEIRKYSKQIRKDYFLDYLDQSVSNDVPDYDQARTLDELLQLSLELKAAASQIESTLSGYTKDDKTRVVDVEDLQQASAESLTKQVDRLAKTIEKSGRRL